MSVRQEQDGAVSVVTIDRPEAMNAFDPETAEALLETVEATLEEPVTDALVIEGAGERAFCTGADLERFAEALDEGDAVQVVSRVSGTMNELIRAIVGAEEPVVAALNGTAAGGGLGLALACDLRIAAEDARLTPAFLDVGVSPDGGTTWFLPRMVGLARAREILLENEVLDAEQAHDEGLVTEVVPQEDVRKRARARARELAAGPRQAIASTKAHLAAQARGLDEHLDAERQATSLSAEKDDFREGVEAFLDRRDPDFG